MPLSLSIFFKTVLGVFIEVITTPIWWYSGGVTWIIRSLTRSVVDTANGAGLGLWIRNMFVPMYGQYDIWGRIISFMVRVGNIIGRGIWVLIWTLVCCVVFVLWLIAPAIGLYFLFLGLITASA